MYEIFTVTPRVVISASYIDYKIEVIDKILKHDKWYVNWSTDDSLSWTTRAFQLCFTC